MDTPVETQCTTGSLKKCVNSFIHIQRNRSAIKMKYVVMVLHPLLCIHIHTLQVVSPDAVGVVGWLWVEEMRRAKMPRRCQFIPETPLRAQSAIHHICIPICMLTSHTHTILNKLPSARKHVPHGAAHSCTHSVYTHDHTASHIHHVVLTVCFYWTITFKAPPAQCSWAVHFTPLWRHWRSQFLLSLH